MAYLPVPFPSEIAPEPTGGPAFSTAVVTTLVGDEQRNANWLNSRHNFEASHGIKRSADFRAIGAHFRMARGKLHTFRYRDWGDFECARGDGLLLTLTSTTFQLAKNYGSAFGFEEKRRITRPVAGTVRIWKAGALQALDTNYAIDVETGIVTFSAAPGAALLEADFQFDVHCRYDTDELKATLVHLQDSETSLMSWETVPLVEVRE